jgi:hypothetical protein
LRLLVAAACAALVGLWPPGMPAHAVEVPPDATPAENDAGFDELMRLLAERKHGHVTFTETHVLGVLRRPLHSSGELVYDAPDRLEKRTLKPQAEDLVLSGNVLTVSRGGHTHTLDLARHPEIAPWVESIRATLAGDRAALERYFEVSYSGEPAHWKLVLVPRNPDPDASIATVLIEGSGAMPQRFEIRQADGDRSVMTIGAELTP